MSMVCICSLNIDKVVDERVERKNRCKNLVSKSIQAIKTLGYYIFQKTFIKPLDWIFSSQALIKKNSIE
jgi:hypothetical protein